MLQERSFERLGGRKSIPVDVRIVAATNRDLDAAIEAGKFREDLYYRLNVISLQTPPLREIREDIPLLARHLLREAASELKRPDAELNDEALELLSAYDWRGNVRQLQNEMRRAIIYARNGMVGRNELSPALRALAETGAAARTLAASAAAGGARPGAGGLEAPGDSTGNSTGDSLAEQVERLERARIREALEACGYNQVKTARRLGLSRQGLINKLKRYGLGAAPAEQAARGNTGA